MYIVLEELVLCGAFAMASSKNVRITVDLSLRMKIAGHIFMKFYL
jgi:hypothetical protein